MKIFEAITGSRAYGLATPESDIDQRSIYIRPFEDLLSLYDLNKGHVIDETDDKQLFELRHFMFLLSKSNPNALELLWSPASQIKHQEPVMEHLLSIKSELLTKQVAETSGNYALMQLKRICGHRQKITNPQPIEKPQLKAFIRFEKNNGYTATESEVQEALNNYICTKMTNGMFKAWLPTQGFNGSGLLSQEEDSPVFYDFSLKRIEEYGLLYQGVFIINWEGYKKAINEWQKYWHWKENRNVNRKKMEEQYGFDCKHAMHLIRLLDSAIDVFRFKELRVERPNREEMLAIKNGSLSYDEMLEIASSKFEEVKKMAAESDLPEKPDSKLLQNLYQTMIIKTWGLSWLP